MDCEQVAYLADYLTLAVTVLVSVGLGMWLQARDGRSVWVRFFLLLLVVFTVAIFSNYAAVLIQDWLYC